MGVPVDRKLARRLTRAREDAGLSLRELARRLGLSAATVLDAGQGRDARLSTLRRHAETLPGLLPHELLGRPAPAPPLASEAAWRSLCAAFGFSVRRLRWEVRLLPREDGEPARRTLLEALGVRPLDASLRDPGVRRRLAHLLLRGSPAARRALDEAVEGLEPGGEVAIEDACFTHRFARDRRGALDYRREQGEGAPPPGFGRPGTLSQSAPGPDGLSLVVDLPARELELVARDETGGRGEDAWPHARAGAWADAQPLATDEPDLAPFLWPGGARPRRRGGALHLLLAFPELGLQHGLLWGGEEPESRTPPVVALPPGASPGELFAAARGAAGLSRRELAARAGVSPATVAGLERGQDPRRSLVRRMLDELPALRAEALLPVEPARRLLTRRELWERQRALLGLEADEERKTLVVNAGGDAQAVCESLGLRRVRPSDADLRLRYASAAGGRLPTELREIEEAVAAESEDSDLRARVLSRSQGRVIHEIVVPRAQAQRGVSYTRRLFTAGFFDPESRDGHDGAALVPFHPVRRLVLSVTLPRGVTPAGVQAAVHPRVLLDGPCEAADLAAGLHPEGLRVESEDDGRTLRLVVEHPLIGFLADLFWRREH